MEEVVKFAASFKYSGEEGGIRTNARCIVEAEHIIAMKSGVSCRPVAHLASFAQA